MPTQSSALLCICTSQILYGGLQDIEQTEQAYTLPRSPKHRAVILSRLKHMYIWLISRILSYLLWETHQLPPVWVSPRKKRYLSPFMFTVSPNVAPTSPAPRVRS
ncbi:hypothetical protein OBBRIDRAFT_512948 [Obba rivulosa]|uniref:Uncharacterized protein n=1 Tax=Obba rivulosa TaxID=1052685 RepID=A0A8E2B0I7_9APHY|nr:hypothetical protein OBBRIDRAFT_512948 [Obba rivulosa]